MREKGGHGWEGNDGRDWVDISPKGENETDRRLCVEVGGRRGGPQLVFTLAKGPGSL